MMRPEGETRRERRLQRIVGTGVVVLFLLLGIIVLQGIVGYQSQENHHTASQALQTEIIAKDKQTITLLKEHSSSFAAQKKSSAAQAKYDADVKILAQELVAQQAAICTATHAACPPLQKLP